MQNGVSLLSKRVTTNIDGAVRVHLPFMMVTRVVPSDLYCMGVCIICVSQLQVDSLPVLVYVKKDYSSGKMHYKVIGV